MTELDAILAGVLEAPDDDTPRLVYADRLDDLGMYERAEFVRVQCELAQLMPASALDQIILGGIQEHLRDIPATTWAIWPDVCGMMRRAGELFEAYRDQWFPVPAGYGFDWRLATRDDCDTRPGYVVRRGFVDEIRCDLRAFLGGRCPACDVGPGVRRYPTHGGDWIEDDCNECSGTGTVAGLDLGAVFGRWPVRRVVLTDREPRENPSGSWYWPWQSAYVSEDVRIHALPEELMRRGLNRGGVSIGYPTRAAALDALSAACVRLGRDAARWSRELSVV